MNIEKIIKNSYEIKHSLGEGSFGKVFKVVKLVNEKNKDDKNNVMALKVVNIPKKDMFVKCFVALVLFFFFSISRAQIWLEFNFQKQVSSENVVRVLKHYYDNGNGFLFIEMECVKNGSLLDLFRCCLYERKLLSFKSIWIIFLQLLKGMDGLYCLVLIFIHSVRYPFRKHCS
jgi:serine/threonine protein kinase